MTDRFNIDALLEDLAERIASKLAQRLPAGSGAGVQPRLLTVNQAASYLGRTKAATQHMVASGSLPVVRHDRRVFLDRLNLDRWIESAKS
jgi:excisionase family DNA binding protein